MLSFLLNPNYLFPFRGESYDIPSGQGLPDNVNLQFLNLFGFLNLYFKLFIFFIFFRKNKCFNKGIILLL